MLGLKEGHQVCPTFYVGSAYPMSAPQMLHPLNIPQPWTYMNWNQTFIFQLTCEICVSLGRRCAISVHVCIVKWLDHVKQHICPFRYFHSCVVRLFRDPAFCCFKVQATLSETHFCWVSCLCSAPSGQLGCNLEPVRPCVHANALSASVGSFWGVRYEKIF